MRIDHQESGISYEITEERGGFKLVNSCTNRPYFFKESYEALWLAIELIRNSSFDNLTEDDLKEIYKSSRVALSSVPKSLIAMLRREKISRTYYDQIFLELLSLHRSGKESVLISNKTNFIVHHELGHLIRNFVGSKSSLPVDKV